MHAPGHVSNHYLRFLQQVHRMTKAGRLADLEPECSRLLDEIAIEDHNASPLTVTALMGLSHIASPATLHRKMQRLLQDGLIELSIDASNKRSKFVVLSKKGHRRYQTLSTLMTDAITA
jgi:DNA-binding MarR family transcriptional regulator